MRLRLLLLVAGVTLASGCEQHVLTDYRALDKDAVWSGAVAQLKALNASDSEIQQVLKLKDAGISEDTCVALIRVTHEHKHPFSSGDAAADLARAGFPESQILEMASFDQLDSLSGEAVALKLVGLSDSTIHSLLERHLRGLPVLSSAEIARLKNTGLSEREILERISRGMTDAQADHEAWGREVVRDHSGTGFVRPRGRKPR